MNLKKRIEEETFSPFKKREGILLSGMILNSYYDKDSGNKNPTIFLDIGILDSGGTVEETYTKVPMVKIGGVSQILPPSGAMAIIGKINNADDSVVCLGWIESYITETFLEDDKSPPTPPGFLVK